LWMCAQPLSNICTTVSENWQKNTWKWDFHCSTSEPRKQITYE
jgi:hypothetical protein